MSYTLDGSADSLFPQADATDEKLGSAYDLPITLAIWLKCQGGIPIGFRYLMHLASNPASINGSLALVVQGQAPASNDWFNTTSIDSTGSAQTAQTGATHNTYGVDTWLPVVMTFDGTGSPNWTVTSRDGFLNTYSTSGTANTTSHNLGAALQYLRIGEDINTNGDFGPQALTVSTASPNAAPIQIVTSTAHGYANGAYVTFTGMTGGFSALNGVEYQITTVDNTTFTLNGTDSTGYSAYTGGGTCKTRVSLIAEPAIWRKVLTQSEIEAYLAGDPPEDIAASDLIAHWSLEDDLSQTGGIDTCGALVIRSGSNVALSADHPTISRSTTKYLKFLVHPSAIGAPGAIGVSYGRNT